MCVPSWVYMYHMHEKTRIFWWWHADTMSSEARITGVVHYLAWVLGTEPRSSGKATNALTVKPFPIYEQSIKIMSPQLNDSRESSITICVHCLSSYWIIFFHYYIKNEKFSGKEFISVTEGKDPGEWREVVTHRKDRVTGSENHISLVLRKQIKGRCTRL